LAERALARPGAAELLARPQPQSARYLVLQDARWVLARRAFYAHDYARALAMLNELAPVPSDAALHALFVAGSLRGLARPEAADAFRRAAAISGDDAFRTACKALAEHAAESFSREAGPWSLQR
ncbi:MAG TPA: hypothetical protein VHZ95_21660, partial [Polyangiales bacterium]|nr:hypothetical protein [Polyangiales bacterium]